MPKPIDRRKYFIVKHDLDAFTKLPNYIWRTDKLEDDVPHRFSQVKVGDRWIGFAYTTSNGRERPLSRVTGFYECTTEFCYGDVPQVVLSHAQQIAWLIKGMECGIQPIEPVGVPPIDSLLDKKLWKNQAIVPITADDFDRIRNYTLDHQFATKKIPLFGREPENEQELLAAVVYAHKQIGIGKIIRVRKAFPDLLVQLEGSADEVHLELEVYSDGFFLHGHNVHVEDRKFRPDKRPIAVLCWIDNRSDVKNHVHQVYELQTMIREDRKIIW